MLSYCQAGNLPDLDQGQTIGNVNIAGILEVVLEEGVAKTTWLSHPNIPAKAGIQPSRACWTGDGLRPKP